MKLVPLSNKIVVKRDDAEAKSKGGIVLPDNAKEKPRRGKVLAVGAGAFRDDGTVDPMLVSEGMTVIFTAYAGNEVEHEGDTYVILSQDDVLAVVC